MDMPLFEQPVVDPVREPDPIALARTGDRETSHRAARKLRPRSAMVNVLRMFQERHPVKWADIDGNSVYRRRFGGAEGTFRKRRNDLVCEGFIEEDGENGAHTLWRLTAKGVAWTP